MTCMSILQLNLSCLDGEKLFTWDMFLLETDGNTRSIKLPGTNQPHQEEILLPASSLVAGLYRIIFSISIMPYRIVSSATGYFRVQRRGLVAQIDCGNARNVSRNMEIVLNASRSHDPNDLDGSGELFFEWFCDKSHGVSCFSGSIKRNAPVLVFSPRFFTQSVTYEFVVNVSVAGGQSAEAQQTVTLVEDDIPPLCVRCLENCAHKLTTSKSLLLGIAGCEKESSARCMWKLINPSGHRTARRFVDSHRVGSEFELNDPSDHRITRRSVDTHRMVSEFELDDPSSHQITRRAVNSHRVGSQFELDPSDLIANKTYKVFFDLGAVSAEYSFVTDMIPSGGRCDVTPPEGQVIETPFKIVCSNWKDDDSPLWYEFFYVHPETGIKLLCYGWEPYCTDLALPSGSPETNYTVQLLAKITDRLSSFKTVSLKVKVTSPEK